MPDRGLILSLLSMRGCCPADGKAWYPDEYRQPEPGNQSRQPPDEVHPAAYPKPQRLDYRAGEKTERAACTKGGGGSDTSSQSADEVYGDTKGRTEGLDKGWTEPGTSQDLKAVSEALSYLRQKGLSTVEDLEAFLESSGKSAADYRNQMKPKEARSKVIDGILASRTDCKECKPVYEKYQKIFLRKQRRNSNRNTRRLPGMRKPPPTLPSTRTIRTVPKRSCKRSRKRFSAKSQS